MMEDYRVTTDELFAAGATFTLLAWGFAFACLCGVPDMVSRQHHRRYQSRGTAHLSRAPFPEFHQSFGDWPWECYADRSAGAVLVILEQFAGVAYIAVVVSRLIGMSITRRKGTS